MPLISDTKTIDTIKEIMNNLQENNIPYSNIPGGQVDMAMLKEINAQDD